MQTVASTIAIVSDCDDTLAPDTTAQLLEAFGVDAKRFYAEDAKRYVDQGYDPPLAYMTAMLDLVAGGGPLAGLTYDAVREFAQRLQFFPGVPQVLWDLEREVEQTYGKFGISLEEYVITGGLADLVEASELGKVVDRVWGCNFGYEPESGRVRGIKNVVSFTEKTRFLFDIEKGLAQTATGPYDVNKPMEPDERPVPLSNMVYLGDGPSDIPCMSIVQRARGYVIGILSKNSPYKTWALGFGRRAHVTVPPDFRSGDYGQQQLREAVIQIADSIRVRQTESRRRNSHTPGY